MIIIKPIKWKKTLQQISGPERLGFSFQKFPEAKNFRTHNPTKVCQVEHAVEQSA